MASSEPVPQPDPTDLVTRAKRMGEGLSEAEVKRSSTCEWRR